ncbi:MAG: hypothetical protein LBH05_02945 [Deferribacteraceae bacterium]|jgi:hypothetical protein|nr:hypothetical protein [Deferribacteraceae bacterium]
MNVAKLTEDQLRTTFPFEALSRGEGSVGQFYDCIVKNGDLYGKIKGNHGVYNAVLYTSRTPLTGECNCKTTDLCKHTAALGLSYLYTPWVFKCEDNIDRANLKNIDDIQFYVAMTPLRQFVNELKEQKIALSKLAEITRIPLQQISAAIRDSENGTPHTLTDILKLAILYLLDSNALRA